MGFNQTSFARWVALPVMSSLLSFGVWAQERKTICTWDPIGQNGPVISFIDDVVPKAMQWGLELQFIPYSDEKEAVRDFRAGTCDMVIVTAISSRQLVTFGGSLDAIGAVTSLDELHQVLAAIASDKLAPSLIEDSYEMAISIPVGAMYAYVNDRSIASVQDFKDRNLAVINDDVQVARLAEFSRAIPKAETLTSFGKSFAEGKVDIVMMPATALQTFELSRGMGQKGGVIDIPMYYGMIQGVSRRSAFPPDFGQNMRKWMLEQFPVSRRIITTAEKTIPEEYWIRASPEGQNALRQLYRDIRRALVAEHRFSPKALSLLQHLRCTASPELEECVSPEKDSIL